MYTITNLNNPVNVEFNTDSNPKNEHGVRWGKEYNKFLEAKYKDLMPFKQSIKLSWQARHPTEALQKFDEQESTHNLTRVLLPYELFNALFEGDSNEHLAFIQVLEMVYSTPTGVRLINYALEKGEKWQIVKNDDASICDIKNNRLYLRSNESSQQGQQQDNQYSIVDEYVHEIAHCCTRLPDKDGDHPSGPTNELTLRILVEAEQWDHLRIEYDDIEHCHESLYGMFKLSLPYRADAKSAQEDAWRLYGCEAYQSFIPLFLPGDNRLATLLLKHKEPSEQQYREIKQLIIEAMAQNSLQESGSPLPILNQEAQLALESFNKNQKLFQAHIETKAVIYGNYQARRSRESEDLQLLSQSASNSAADFAETKAILHRYYRGLEADKDLMKQRDDAAKRASASKARESNWSVAALVAGTSVLVEGMDRFVESATAKKTNIFSLIERGELRQQRAAEKAEEKELKKEINLINENIKQLNKNLEVLEEAYKMTQAFLNKCASAVTPRSLVEAIDRKNKLSNTINRESRLRQGQIEKIEILDDALLTRIAAYTLAISNEELKKNNMKALGMAEYKEKLENIKQESIQEKRIAAASSSVSADQLADHEIDRILNPVAGSSKDSEYIELPDVPETSPGNSPPAKKKRQGATPVAELVNIEKNFNPQHGRKLISAGNSSEMKNDDQFLDLSDIQSDDLLQSQQESMDLSDIIDDFIFNPEDLTNPIAPTEDFRNVVIPAPTGDNVIPLITGFDNIPSFKNRKNEILATGAFNLVRNRFKDIGIKSANKVRINDAASIIRNDYAQHVVREVKRKVFKPDLTTQPDFSEAWKAGAGNCDEMAGIASHMINYSGGYARRYRFNPQGMHAFTLVGVPPQDAVDNINFSDYHGCWVVDPWAGIICEAGSYSMEFKNKMNSWAGKDKMISHGGGWIDANSAGWLDAAMKNAKEPILPEYFYPNPKETYLESEN